MPIVFFSMRWAIKSGVRAQLLSLPELLRDPSVEFAMKKAVNQVALMGTGAVSKAIGRPIGTTLSLSLEKALTAGLNEGMVQISQKISGQVGGYVNDIKKKATGGRGFGTMADMVKKFDDMKKNKGNLAQGMPGDVSDGVAMIQNMFA